MSDDEIITLDTGEQVRVTSEGEKILIPGPDPEIADIVARQAESAARQAEIRQAQRDLLDAKRQQDAADPAVPPEKRIF
jgi:hypothetical protein